MGKNRGKPTGTAGILYQGTDTYESWNNIALIKGGQNSPIYKGWKPCKLSMVFTSDCSQLSFTKDNVSLWFDRQDSDKILMVGFQLQGEGWDLRWG